MPITTLTRRGPYPPRPLPAAALTRRGLVAGGAIVSLAHPERFRNETIVDPLIRQRAVGHVYARFDELRTPRHAVSVLGQKESGIDTNSNLYRVPLIRNGRVFMTYSARATDSRYCLRMLTACDDADLLDTAAWTKSQTLVFKTAPERHIYGPGHDSFTVDPSGRDVLVFHARVYEAITGDPLYDPNRHTRVQRFRYRADGTPDFGLPIGNGRYRSDCVAGSAAGRIDCFARTAGSLAKA